MEEKSSIKISAKAFISSIVILLVLMILAGTLTYVIPRGSYQREDIDGNAVIVPDTFAFNESEPYPVWRWFTAPVEVLWSSDAVTVIFIIVFIFIIGGVFTVLDKCGLLKYIMMVLVRRFSGAKYKLMALLMLFFMLFGSVFGIFEELVALVPIVIVLSLALGWDSLTGLGMSALAAGFGFSAATMNPFTLGVAQRLVGLDAFSGLLFRVVFLAICYVCLYLFVSRYAKKVEKMPEKSLVYLDDSEGRAKYSDVDAIGSLPNEKQLARTEAIIQSMTREEREKPDIINASRKIRIAKGAGTTVEEVNKLLKQFDSVCKMMKQFTGGGKKRGMFGKMKMPF